jgi:hypothetical protein
LIEICAATTTILGKLLLVLLGMRDHAFCERHQLLLIMEPRRSRDGTQHPLCGTALLVKFGASESVLSITN